jgi:hypothetical protein
MVYFVKAAAKIEGFGATNFREPSAKVTKDALTLGCFLANTSLHEKLGCTYRGGTAHGQDGVTIRR